MPTTNTNNSLYSGDSTKIILAAFESAKTIKNGYMSFAGAVKGSKFNIPSLKEDGGFVNASAGWNPDGSITVKDNAITLKRVMRQRNVDKEAFIAANPSMEEILSAVAEDQARKASKKFDRDVWIGVPATDGDFGGLVPLLEADGNVQKPTASGEPVTTANVLAELAIAKAEMTADLRGEDDVKIYVASNVASAYEQKLIEQGVSNGLGGEGAAMKYGKYDVVEVSHLEDNTIIIFGTSNVWAVSDAANPDNEVTVSDTDATLLDGYVRSKIVFGGGAGYAHSEDIVYYVSQ